MHKSIEILKEISRRCQAGEALSAEQSRWLAAALTSFLEQRCRSLHEALGLRFARGGVPWWREQAIRGRDAALRELAERFYADLSPSAQARQLSTMATRYAASAWRHDRNRDGMPAHYRGTAKEHLWRAFTSGATMPLCERQMRNILTR
jgi:hypothetical protein